MVVPTLNINPDNTIIVRKPSDFGQPDGSGCILLDGTIPITYSLYAPITMPYELKIVGTVTIWDATLGSNTITFTGSTAFKSDGTVFADLTIFDTRVACSSTTQVFDMDLNGGTFANVRSGIDGGSAIGRMDNASLINNVNTSWTNALGGWTINNVGILALQGQVMSSAGYTVPGPILTVTGTVGRLIDITRTIWINFGAGNSIFDFDDGIIFGAPFGVHSIIIINNQMNATSGAVVFATDSFDNTSPELLALANGGIPASMSIGEFNMLSNITETVITAQNTPVKITGTTVEGNLERFTHSNGRLTYIGLEDLTIRCQAVARAKINANNEDDTYSVYLVKNVSTLADSQDQQILGTALSNPSTLFIPFSLIPLSTNDFVEVFVENNSVSNENILFESLKLVMSI